MRFDPADSGATPLAGGACRFRVWAPDCDEVSILVQGVDRSRPRRAVMRRDDGRGYHEIILDDVPRGSLYTFELTGGRERPDPASRAQPEGIHGPSEVIDVGAFDWTDTGWRQPGLESQVFYELHVGTFTPAGTFEAIIPRLEALAELGVTTIELMPIAQFPGSRNWGYDGVLAFAAQNSYGGPQGLSRLVNSCHERGLAVALDVVYNHLGPEGNYLRDFGPYFTDRYHTPWGAALNFDGPESDDVRRYFIESALYWLRDLHIDALRLDAVHAIIDSSPLPFVEELTAAAHELAERQGRRIHIIAESASNDPRIIRPREVGGFGCDSQWNDDFHHALHALLTGESEGYYAGYGAVGDFAKAWREGYVFTGERSPFHRRRHGRRAGDAPGRSFVVFAQNHDQIGNRRDGERLSALIDFESQKLAAGAVMLAPFVPMLFMGEEYGESAPFLYFVSHGDPELIEAVRRGRAREFESFGWEAEPPDPQAIETFERSRLNWGLRERGAHAAMLEFHRDLIRLRREIPALEALDRWNVLTAAQETDQTLIVRRRCDGSEVVAAFNFGEQSARIAIGARGGPCWVRRIDSAASRYAGPGETTPETLDVADGPGELTLARRAFALYERSGGQV